MVSRCVYGISLSLNFLASIEELFVLDLQIADSLLVLLVLQMYPFQFSMVGCYLCISFGSRPHFGLNFFDEGVIALSNKKGLVVEV